MSNDKSIMCCVNCGTALDGSTDKCPKCGLLPLKNLPEFIRLATDEVRKLLEKFDENVKNPVKSDISQYLQEAKDWRKDRTFENVYVKDKHKVLHLREDGDIDVKVVKDFGSDKVVWKANSEKVYYWTAAAAERGSVKALRELASYKLCGFGCKRGTINAIAMFARAAMCGDKEAYLTLVNGEIKIDYHCGYINQDESKSNLTRIEFWQKRNDVVAELERFAAANMIWAKYLQGVMCLRGLKVEKDTKKGIALILSAAEDGPCRVERAMKDKALLQFDKLIDLNGQNNVDAAIETYWKMKSGEASSEAYRAFVDRTSFANSTERGPYLLRLATIRFKEANNAKWITLPHSLAECEALQKGLGISFYPGKCNSIKIDGKTYKVFSPFLGKSGVFGTNGLCIDWRQGLEGNLRPAGEPSDHMGFEACWGFPIACRPKIDKCSKNGQKYIDWDIKVWNDDPINFKPAGFSEADLLTLIDYVRRYAFSDLVAGVELVDGSIQKKQLASKIDLPMGPSNHTLYILKQLGLKTSISQSSNVSVQKERSKSANTENKETMTASNASGKRRWKYMLLGVLFGWLGAHYLYAKRIYLLLLLWASFITGVAIIGSSQGGEMQQQQDASTEVAKKSTNNEAIGGGCIALWALLWLGGTFFVKTDGNGNRM